MFQQVPWVKHVLQEHVEEHPAWTWESHLQHPLAFIAPSKSCSPKAQIHAEYVGDTRQVVKTRRIQRQVLRRNGMIWYGSLTKCTFPRPT